MHAPRPTTPTPTMMSFNRMVKRLVACADPAVPPLYECAQHHHTIPVETRLTFSWAEGRKGEGGAGGSLRPGDTACVCESRAPRR